MVVCGYGLRYHGDRAVSTLFWCLFVARYGFLSYIGAVCWLAGRGCGVVDVAGVVACRPGRVLWCGRVFVRVPVKTSPRACFSVLGDDPTFSLPEHL